MGGRIQRRQRLQKATRANAIDDTEGFEKDIAKPTDSKCQLRYPVYSVQSLQLVAPAP